VILASLTIIYMKSIFSSRTFWLAVAQAVVGIYAIVVTQHPEIATIGYVAIVKSVIDIVLRYLTNQPVSITGTDNNQIS
jgi:hypothetical protein